MFNVRVGAVLIGSGLVLGLGLESYLYTRAGRGSSVLFDKPHDTCTCSVRRIDGSLMIHVHAVLEGSMGPS